jgi:hypothetical protein
MGALASIAALTAATAIVRVFANTSLSSGRDWFYHRAGAARYRRRDISSFSMIFSENQLPLFGIMLD